MATPTVKAVADPKATEVPEEELTEAIGEEESEVQETEGAASGEAEEGDAVVNAEEGESEDEQIAAFRAMFADGELDEPEARQTESRQQQQEQPFAQATSFRKLSKAEYDNAMESPEAFNEIRQQDYVNAVSEGVQKAVSYMNQVMEQRLRVERIVSEFYGTYRDLRPHKTLVKAAIEEVRAKKPKATLPEILVEAAKATRVYVANKNGKAKQKSTTQQLSIKSARQPVVKKASSPQEAKLKAFTQRYATGAK